MRGRSFVAGVATLLAVASCSTTSGEGGFVAGSGNLARVPVEQRVAAPHLVGTTLEGKAFDSASTAGKVVVYNVWGSWCAPCRKEAPALAAAAKATSDKAVFVGINTRDSGTAQGLAMMREAGATYESLYDPEGRLLLNFSSLPPSAIPSTIVVDRQGKIAARVLGETTETTLTGLVDEVAAGR